MALRLHWSREGTERYLDSEATSAKPASSFLSSACRHQGPRHGPASWLVSSRRPAPQQQHALGQYEHPGTSRYFSTVWPHLSATPSDLVAILSFPASALVLSCAPHPSHPTPIAQPSSPLLVPIPKGIPHSPLLLLPCRSLLATPAPRKRRHQGIVPSPPWAPGSPDTTWEITRSLPHPPGRANQGRRPLPFPRTYTKVEPAVISPSIFPLISALHGRQNTIPISCLLVVN